VVKLHARWTLLKAEDLLIKSRHLSLFLLMVSTNQVRLTANTINTLQAMFKPETA
jgi:hypothetical protein